MHTQITPHKSIVRSLFGGDFYIIHWKKCGVICTFFIFIYLNAWFIQKNVVPLSAESFMLGSRKREVSPFASVKSPSLGFQRHTIKGVYYAVFWHFEMSQLSLNNQNLATIPLDRHIASELKPCRPSYEIRYG